jgi:hypothetical protein
MENIHMMVTGRVRKSDGLIYRRVKTVAISKKQALIELKQLLTSLERAGIVHEIEDRESEFNGVEIDYIMIARPVFDDHDDPADDYDEIEGNDEPDDDDDDEFDITDDDYDEYDR